MVKGIIRITKGHVLMLCDRGHILQNYELDDRYGGSSVEMELGFGDLQTKADHWANGCQGEGHHEEKVKADEK